MPDNKGKQRNIAAERAHVLARLRRFDERRSRYGRGWLSAAGRAWAAGRYQHWRRESLKLMPEHKRERLEAELEADE